MDLKSQATLLNQFLIETKLFWEGEILDGYPEILNQFPAEWLSLLDQLSFDEWFEFECHRPISKLQNTSLQSYLDKIEKLCKLEKAVIPQGLKLEDWAYTDVKFKKTH